MDTLDNLDWEGATGGAVARQGAFNLGGLSEENWIRIQEQNEKPISVIIGNPPYNANQQNENDNNKNREYPEIDRRIRDTYIASSTAQKTKQYDMYKRFIRWASDRLADDGIIGFVSNSAFLDARQDDGFRKVVAREFNELWVLDLKGNARTSGERRQREAGNVFDDKIRVGVAVYFLVRREGLDGFRVFHHAIDDYVGSRDKVDYVKGASLTTLGFDEITPDSKSNWLNQSNSNFERLIPLADRQTKLAKSADEERAVFRLNSLGVATNRDDWAFDKDAEVLADKIRFFCATYRNEMKRLSIEKPDISSIGDWVDRSIKWTAELEQHLVKGSTIEFVEGNIVPSLYRPFTAKYSYYAPIITHRRYQQPLIFPPAVASRNKVICFSGVASTKPFSVLATDRLYSLDLIEKTQCLPLYRYTEDGERVSNITRWGIDHINGHYRQEWGEEFESMAGEDGITAEEIFAYTYAVLHDPAYRHEYALDLLREFPRLPLYPDFHHWTEMGQKLLDLHIGFESAEPYPLERHDREDVDPKRAILGADKSKGTITLDERTTLAGVPEKAWEYRLGSRSALEWVLDQYKERKPRDPTIREKFNNYRFSDHKERVCTVSAATMEIVDSMAQHEALGR